MRTKMNKRWIGVLLCTLIIGTLIGVSVFGTFGSGSVVCAEEGCGGTYTNGFCSADGTHYQPAVYNEEQGRYEIGNAGQLYWFAQKVSTENETYGAVDAVLTADITVNTGSITGKTEGMRAWTPIGASFETPYGGHFDGQGYTVSGLYFFSENLRDTYVGLFGCISHATVENVNVVNFYFQSRRAFIGGISGRSYDSTVQSCYTEGSIFASDVYSSAGGIVGISSTYGNVIRGCLSNTALRVTTDPDEFTMTALDPNIYIGAILGTGGGEIVNCIYVTDAYSGAITQGSCSVSNSQGMASTALTDGVAAHLLGTAWGQNLDNGQATQPRPVLGGAVVYHGYTDCTTDDLHYSNTKLNPTKGHKQGFAGVAHEIVHACIYCGAGESGRITLIAPEDLTFAEGVAKEVSYVCTLEDCSAEHPIEYCCPNGCRTTGMHTATLSHGGAIATLSFEIKSNLTFPSDISIEIVTQQQYLTYHGPSGVKPTLRVKRGNTELTLDTDYSVYYGNNVDVTDAAQATVVLHVAGYEGAAKTVSFRIDPYNMNMVTSPDSSRIEVGMAYGDPMWSALPITLSPIVGTSASSFQEEYVMVEGRDFIVHLTEEEYRALGAGVHTVLIEGIGNFTGTKQLSLSIDYADIADPDRFEFKLEESLYYYNGAEIIPPRFTIYDKLRGEYLRNGVDFYMSQNFSIPGTHGISVMGDGSYKGVSSELGTFTILARPVMVDVATRELAFDFIPNTDFGDSIEAALSPSLILSGTDHCPNFKYEYRRVGETEFVSGLPTIAGEYEVRAIADSYNFTNMHFYEVSPSETVSLSINKIRINVTVFDQLIEEGAEVDTYRGNDTCRVEVSLSNDELDEYSQYFLNLPQHLTVSGDDILVGEITVHDALSREITESCEITVVTGKAHFFDQSWTAGLEVHSRRCTYEGCDYTQESDHHSHVLTEDEATLTVSGACGVCGADCGAITLVLPENAVYNGKPHYATLSGEIRGIDMSSSDYVQLVQPSECTEASSRCTATLYLYSRNEQGYIRDQVMLSGYYPIDYAEVSIEIDPIVIEQYADLPTELVYTVTGLLEGHRAVAEWRVNAQNTNTTGTYSINLYGVCFYDADGNEIFNYRYDMYTSTTLTVVAHTEHRSFDAKGFCGICGEGYEAPPTDENGVYLLSKPGHLFWLAEASQGYQTINAALAGNIDLNDGYTFTLDASGDLVLKSGDITVSDLGVLRAWTPIRGINIGTFDGRGYTVSGLYVEGTEDNVGLFASIGAVTTVQNVKLANSYIQGGNNVGGIVGDNNMGGTIENCHNSAIIKGEYSALGGVVGLCRGNVIGCSNSGRIIGYDEVGGIVGRLAWGTIERCFNTGDLTSSLSCGGIVGVITHAVTVNKCYNTGDITATGDWRYAGGIVGENGGSVSHCYNTGNVTSTDGVSVGGISGYNYYFTEELEELYGRVQHCYSTGRVSAQGTGTAGGIIGSDSFEDFVSSCYYLTGSASGGIEDVDVAGEAEAKTAEQFASGEVAYLLNYAYLEHIWGQTIGTQAFPVLDGIPVYRYLECDRVTYLYTNVENTPDNEHVDEDRDHVCDRAACGGFVGDHVAAEDSHLCDWCGERASECLDENRDHACDVCGETLSECFDEDDHRCDVCGETLSECFDEDDHWCDVCGIYLSGCFDEDDHFCDLCGEPFGECFDTDDHLCDICGEPWGGCFDTNDHRCDICGDTLSSCFDGDDHLCDICGTPLSECFDEDDHFCDLCGEPWGECLDADDHLCDICGAPWGECFDTDDHLCDICGETLSECFDEDDHLCDICGTPLSECFDEDDHFCDLCGEPWGECFDTNDHRCDICGDTLSSCFDEDDHLCDICGEVLSECEDLDLNHLCDCCGEKLSDHVLANGGDWLVTDDHHWKQCEYAGCGVMLEPQEAHDDGDFDHQCDDCRLWLSNCEDTDNDHLCDLCSALLSGCDDLDLDHLCDVCGDALSTCADDDSDHLCDVCGDALSTCADGDNDHLCDVCGDALSTCADGDNDHLCDICGDALSTCADRDNDHLCDVCGDALSTCADDDSDHLCDVCGDELTEHAPAGDGVHECPICGETAEDCVDADRDHECEICQCWVGDHESTDGDSHDCDYCGLPVSECTDADRDHACDVCGDRVGEHVRGEDGETCDHCGEVVICSCVDADKNHRCDLCNAEMGAHEAAGGSHNCGYCNQPITQCNDADKNHRCDVCNTVMGAHEAAEGSHNCGYCNQPITQCNDADKNHRCDVCNTEMGVHEAAVGSHNCGYCNQPITQCNDADKNHRCDLCSTEMGTHEAAEGSHNCGYCNQPITQCNDADKNHRCDVCNAEMGAHEAAVGSHNCGYCNQPITQCNDADKNHHCDVCNIEMGAHEAAGGSHVCDYCGQTASDHAWSAATCTTPKTCTVCGATEGGTIPHTPGEWVIDKPAAPGVAGERHQSCTVCGDVLKTEDIDPLPIETTPSTDETEPATDTPTEPATDPTEEKSGCASSVHGGMIVWLSLLGMGAMLLRKKRIYQE